MDPLLVLRSPLHRMSVCPHDTARNVHAWFFLSTHLQTRLGLRLRFEPRDDVVDERERVLGGDADLVYANPYSAVLFERELGFVPVARPVGISDGAYLIARKGWSARQAGARVLIASATDKLIVHALGATLLGGVGLTAERVDHIFTGNHLAVAKAVTSGPAELGYIFDETWHGLAEFSRSGLQVVGRSVPAAAFHCFMVGGALRGRAEEVGRLLCRLASDEQGARVLGDLHFGAGLEPVPSGALGRLAPLMDLQPVR